jgi:hypothetical protein
LAFLGVYKGSSNFKNTTTIATFLQQVHVENCSRKLYQNFDGTVCSMFLVLSRFQVLRSDGSSKTLQRTFCKKIVSNIFYKKIDKTSKTDFYRFCLSRFGAFLGDGSSKTLQTISRKKLTLVLFWPLTHPPTTGVTDFFFAGPLLPAISKR